MRLSIRAHYDGRFIVPEHSVDLPVNQPLNVEVTTLSDNGAAVEDRRKILHSFLARIERRPVPHLSDEAIRRENVYEDR